MNVAAQPIADPAAVTEFVTRWKGNTGSERANFQSFMRELCELLELPLPDPGKAENEHNAYVFERFIAPQRADSTTEKRYIDLYRRDCFVLEGKQTGKTLATQSHQNAINAAVSQAERYVRGLPLEEVEHGRPPFVVVVDVGNAIYLFAEFSRTGGNYVACPDPRHHEIRLDDLHRPEVQDRLRRLWLDPHSLDPSKHAARVTKQVSATLAQLAKSLEQELLMRVVALNKQRAAEEAQGKVRWLRSGYQAAGAIQVGTEQAEAPTAAAPAAKGKTTFPKSHPEQLKVLREALAERPHTVESLADLFKRKPRKSIEEGLLSLSAVGRADYEELSGIWYSAV